MTASSHCCNREMHVGIDLVEVARMDESLRRFGDRFTQRVFTSDEIVYCESSSVERARRFAARLAAKEATWKALGLDDTGHDWRAIEVVRAPSGACGIVLHEPLLGRAEAVGVRPVSVSLTHEATYAAAVVLTERADPSPSKEF